LEHELDAGLFVRTTRRVELTAAGQVLYDKAQVIAAAQDAGDAVAALQGLTRGMLSIGTAQSLGAFTDLPVLLDQFHARYPDIEIHLSEGGSTLLLEKVWSGELDLAFVPIFEPPPGIITTMIACEELVLACPIHHPLAGKSNLLLAELKDEHFVDFQPGWGNRLIVDHAFAQVRVEQHIAFEVTGLGTLLVARGLGIPEPLALARANPNQAMPIAMAELGRPEICWELVPALVGSEAQDARPTNSATHPFIGCAADAEGLS
jgi:DNA-binding transcriptional LysR family regulator